MNSVPMTKRTQLLLIPLLSGLCVTACGNDSTSSGDQATTGSPTDTATSPATGPTTSAPTSTSAPTTSTSVPTGPEMTSGPTGSGPAVPPAPTGSTGGTGGTGGAPVGTPSTGGNGNAGGTPASAGGNGNPGGNGNAGSSAGGAGGSEPAGTAGAPNTPPVEPDVLTVQLQEVRQIIRGFGLNATITDGSNLPWNQLFTLNGTNALGLSILRIGMHEEGGHRNVPSGWETVKSLGARVIGSCWSAPASWKTNNSTTGGGHLLPARYADWATRIANYARTNGLYAMSIANEADFASCSPSQGRPCSPPLTDEYESMVYTGKEMAAFVKVAGPIFKQQAPDSLMIAPEASLWQHVWSNLSPNGEGIPGGGYKSSDPLKCGCFANTIDPVAAETCAAHCKNGPGGELAEGGYDYGHWLASDPETWAAFDIMGVHQYETQVGYAWPADVNGGVRDKEVWQTEMSGVSHWPEQGPSTDIANGIAVARWIHSALTVGEASAWLYWWYKSYFNNNNEGLGLMLNNNINDAPVTKRYFTMGNFSRYIRPDVFHAVRVAGPSPANVMVSAYKGDGGEVVIVAINETGQAVDIPIAITGGTVPAAMVPHVTTASANWAQGTAVPVTDGSLQAALPSMSVTTFVSQ